MSLTYAAGLQTSISHLPERGQMLTTRYSVICSTQTSPEGVVLTAADGDLYDGNNELIYALS